MTWATWLLGLAGPLTIKVLAALGMGLLAFTGVNEVTQSLISSAQTSYGGLPSAVLGLCSLAGVPVGLGTIFGAFAARVALWVAGSTTRLVFK